MNEPVKVRGTVKITEHATGEVREYKNAFLNIGQRHFMQFLKGNFAIDGYRYIGIGTGDQITDLEMTQLEDERYRKEISKITVVGNTLVLDTIIEAEEANFTEPWKELGLYMGGTAGIQNSGLLYNRVKILENKNIRSAVTISWTIEIITT